MAHLTEDRRLAFDRDADAYDAIRPSYPEAIVDHVVIETSASFLVEVGAGTGKATLLFAKREDCTITAIEPGASLARVLRKNVTPYPNVTVAETTFEAWPMEACDVVYAAQSWHWIDPAKRYLKASRIAPSLAIITNEKAPLEASLAAELDAAYAKYAPEPGKDRSVEGKRREQIADIDRCKLYGPVEVTEYPWTQAYSTRDYLALLDTYSDNVVLEPARKQPLYAAIAEAIDRRGGTIEIPYVTLVFIARLR